MENNSFFLRNLYLIQENIDLEKLEKIYDSKMASHLWDKFIYYDRNLLSFINYLDIENKSIFLDAISRNIFMNTIITDNQ